MRNQETTKHDYGHGLLIAGSYGKMGCAILAARAALRSGCGLISVHLPERCVDPMQTAFPEAMVSIDPSPTLFSTAPEHLDRYTAIAVGPGIGTAPATCQALHALLSNLSPSTSHLSPFTTHLSPSLILDADALNILAKEIPHSSFLIQHSILTPHAREYHRLFGDADPAEMARLHNIIIVKKAHHTRVYSPDGQVYENRTGNAGMATAGSGDVLTGILLGMLCSNHLHTNVYDIVCRAVELHGKLGDLALANQSESSLIASDMVENLKHISTDITEC
jgi:NAD(P)H-hydrate epimerase